MNSQSQLDLSEIGPDEEERKIMDFSVISLLDGKKPITEEPSTIKHRQTAQCPAADLEEFCQTCDQPKQGSFLNELSRFNKELSFDLDVFNVYNAEQSEGPLTNSKTLDDLRTTKEQTNSALNLLTFDISCLVLDFQPQESRVSRLLPNRPSIHRESQAKNLESRYLLDEYMHRPTLENKNSMPHEEQSYLNGQFYDKILKTESNTVSLIQGRPTLHDKNHEFYSVLSKNSARRTSSKLRKEKSLSSTISRKTHQQLGIHKISGHKPGRKSQEVHYISCALKSPRTTKLREGEKSAIKDKTRKHK